MNISQWWRARRRRLLQLWVIGLLASLFVMRLSAKVCFLLLTTEPLGGQVPV